MDARRLLIFHPPRPASLGPVYLAFAAIAVVALLGFVLALWPRRDAPAPADYRPLRGESGVSSRGPDDGVLIPSLARDLPGRTRTM